MNRKDIMQKLPKTIRISAHDFTIKEWNAIESHDSGLYGQWSELALEIRVNSTLKLYQVLETLLHEINHAIVRFYNIKEGDNHERVVEAMSVGWTQVYRDNPTLISWIKHVTKYERKK